MTMARRWPDEVRSVALDLFATKGCPAASEATGVPQGTIRAWAHRETARVGTAIERAGSTSVEVVAADASRPAPWRDRRDPLTRDLGDAAVETLAKVREAVAAGRLRDAQSGAIAFGILVDKAQLLSGLATGRSESLSMHLDAKSVTAQIEELERELGYRQ